jgi:hypothetical protein
MNGLHVFQASIFETRLHNLIETKWYYWDEDYRIISAPFDTYDKAFTAWKQSIQVERLSCPTGSCED